MSPESHQAMDLSQSRYMHNPYKSDVYSLGMTALSMATLQDFTDVQMTPEIARETVENLTYSEKVKEVLKRMLEIDPVRRMDFVLLKQYIEYMKHQNEGQFLRSFTSCLDRIKSHSQPQSLSTLLSELFTLSLANTWQASISSPPKLYFNRSELIDVLSTESVNYELNRRIEEYELDYIAAEELGREVDVRESVLVVEKRTADEDFQPVLTLRKSVSMSEIDYFCIKRRYDSIYVSEKASEQPRTNIKLHPNHPNLLHVTDLYAIGCALLCIKALQPSQISISLPSRNEDVISFPADTEVVIGCRPDAGLQIIENGVSRAHAVIRNHQGRWYIEDKGSTNGTWLCLHSLNYKERTSREVRLKEGEILTTDTHQYRFRKQ